MKAEDETRQMQTSSNENAQSSQFSDHSNHNFRQLDLRESKAICSVGRNNKVSLDQAVSRREGRHVETDRNVKYGRQHHQHFTVR